MKILGSRATGKLAATRTSPVTKSGINSSPIKNTRETQSSMSGEIQSSMPGEIQRSMSGGTQRALVQSSLKLAMLIKELNSFQAISVIRGARYGVFTYKIHALHT
jgi:hypothetical protein